MKRRLSWQLKLRAGVIFCCDKIKARNNELYDKKLGMFDGELGGTGNNNLILF